MQNEHSKLTRLAHGSALRTERKDQNGSGGNTEISGEHPPEPSSDAWNCSTEAWSNGSSPICKPLDELQVCEVRALIDKEFPNRPELGAAIVQNSINGALISKQNYQAMRKWAMKNTSAIQKKVREWREEGAVHIGGSSPSAAQKKDDISLNTDVGAQVPTDSMRDGLQTSSSPSNTGSDGADVSGSSPAEGSHQATHPNAAVVLDNSAEPTKDSKSNDTAVRKRASASNRKKARGSKAAPPRGTALSTPPQHDRRTLAATTDRATTRAQKKSSGSSTSAGTSSSNSAASRSRSRQKDARQPEEPPAAPTVQRAAKRTRAGREAADPNLDAPPPAKRRRNLPSPSNFLPIAQQLMSTLKKGARNAHNKVFQALHKHVLETPEKVEILQKVGITDWMLNYLADDKSTKPHYTLLVVLDVLNCMMAVSTDDSVQFVLDRHLVDRVLPYCQVKDAGVRMQALWILGNVGTANFKDAIVRPGIAASIVQSYESVHSYFKDKTLSEVRDRYAETIKQLCSNSHTRHLIVLQRFLPLMADILTNEEKGEPVASICEALNHLIDSNNSNGIHQIIKSGLMPALISRLTHTKTPAQYACIRTLTFVAACASTEQLVHVEPVLDHLEHQLVSSGGQQSTRAKVFTETCMLVAMLCKSSPGVISRIMERSPRVFPILFNALIPRQIHEVKHGKVNALAPNAALAIMYAAQYGNSTDLGYLLWEGLYLTAFKVLRTFGDIPNLLVQTMKALSRMLYKVKNIHDVPREDPVVSEEDCWALVQEMAEADVDSPSSDALPDSDSNIEKDSERTAKAKIRKYAQLLLKAGKHRNLVPAA